MERQRDMVFCHECENEWYRDEHGLTCPDCSSDFTEIIEANHDPRHDHHGDDDVPAHPLHDHNPWAETAYAPDPEEGDVRNFQWRQNQPGGGISMSFSHTFNPHPPTTNANADRTFAQDPVMQSFSDMMQSMLGARPQPNPNSPARPASSQHPDPDGDDPNVRVERGGGPNFHYTTTTRLFPRNANNPQPRAQAFEDLPNLLGQMFQGAPRGAGPDPAFAPMGPLAGLLAGLVNPANMQHGDAVYSQEALDRIISQLMEQNQSGNAAGPASQEAINSLPQKDITTEDLDEATGKADCSICMDDAPLGEKVTLLPCGHWFHGECVKAWLREHDTCPHCRQGIMPRDAPEDASRPRQPGQAARHFHAWSQGNGTRENPFTIPESPTRQRRPSTSGAGLFSRMRDAFGGGGGGASSSGGGGGNPPGSA